MADLAFTLRCLALVLCAWTWRALSTVLMLVAAACAGVSLRGHRALCRWQVRLTLEHSDAH